MMRSFYGLGAADFEMALRAVATDRLDPIAGRKRSPVAFENAGTGATVAW